MMDFITNRPKYLAVIDTIEANLRYKAKENWCLDKLISWSDSLKNSKSQLDFPKMYER